MSPIDASELRSHDGGGGFPPPPRGPWRWCSTCRESIFTLVGWDLRTNHLCDDGCFTIAPLLHASPLGRSSSLSSRVVFVLQTCEFRPEQVALVLFGSSRRRNHVALLASRCFVHRDSRGLKCTWKQLVGTKKLLVTGYCKFPRVTLLIEKQNALEPHRNPGFTFRQYFMLQ